jgi:tetratricopeptide (TPR) repeat protein
VFKSWREKEYEELIAKALLIVVLFIWVITPVEPAYGQNPSLEELNDRSVRLYEQGNYSMAAELAKEALKMAENDLGQNDPQLITFLNNLAVIYYAQKKYAAAKLLYERALGITENGSSSDKGRVTSLIEGIARCRQRLTDEEKTGIIDHVGGEPDAQYSPQFGTGSARESAEYENDIEERDPAASKTSRKVFTVQVGAFRNLSRAKALQKSLYEQVYGACITSSVPKRGETLYKVHVGEFGERNDALAVSSEIRNSTGLDAFITGN